MKDNEMLPTPEVEPVRDGINAVTHKAGCVFCVQHVIPLDDVLPRVQYYLEAFGGSDQGVLGQLLEAVRCSTVGQARPGQTVTLTHWIEARLGNDELSPTAQSRYKA
jgi:hypothetical protein